jgi:hypothetical protein
VPPLEDRNVGRYDPMPPHVREQLAAYFAPHNQRLYQLLGRDLGWEAASRLAASGPGVASASLAGVCSARRATGAPPAARFSHRMALSGVPS